MDVDSWSTLTLAPPKARIARRRVCAGLPVAREDFSARGLELSDGEWQLCREWLERVPRSRVAEAHRAADGTERLAIALADGGRTETVVMPVGAVCVSTQVGCAVGCRFCASGRDGLRRNLTASEIVEQLVHARRRQRVDRVVYMGMGESTHNLDAVLEAVALVHEHARIGPRRQTLSTVGSCGAIERLHAAAVRPCLALSLHTTDPAKRRELLPRAPHRDELASLILAADGYGRAMGMPIQVQWTLLAGVNDGDDELERLAALLRGVRGYVNYILWNRVAGLPFAAPPRERAVELVRALRRRGILATIRNSSGAAAAAACGQLTVTPDSE